MGRTMGIRGRRGTWPIMRAVYGVGVDGSGATVSAMACRGAINEAMAI